MILLGTPAQSTASDAGDRCGGRVKIWPPPYIYKIPLPDNYKNTTAVSSFLFWFIPNALPTKDIPRRLSVDMQNIGVLF
tara:strand:- start:699 stop:935 length:237 start_codon:yes stop_codon:yes gene_type:complete